MPRTLSAAHVNAAQARVSTTQLSSDQVDGGPGGTIWFGLPAGQEAGVNAWIDPVTGGLVVDVEACPFTGPIEIRINSETVTSIDGTSRMLAPV